MCHELVHSLRWEKVPEYAETMFNGMILEGMAVVLEEEAMNKFTRYNGITNSSSCVKYKIPDEKKLTL